MRVQPTNEFLLMEIFGANHLLQGTGAKHPQVTKALQQEFSY
jgi:hypothetical protein